MVLQSLFNRLRELNVIAAYGGVVKNEAREWSWLGICAFYHSQLFYRLNNLQKNFTLQMIIIII